MRLNTHHRTEKANILFTLKINVPQKNALSGSKNVAIIYLNV